MNLRVSFIDRQPLITLSHLVLHFLSSHLTLAWFGNAAFMVNKISCNSSQGNSSVQQLTSDAIIEVLMKILLDFTST